jgi:signal transduction histidine kinase/HAMP domain-containing protein
VLLQWFLLLAGAAAIVLTLSFAGAQKNLVEDRLLLARTIAHHMDATVSAAMQSLGRLSSDLSPLAEDAAGRLHTFRLHSPFREAAYIVDARGRLVVGDPADVRPLPPQRWLPREVITPLIRKSPDDARPVVAIVQPLSTSRASYHLVSEMQPLGSVLSVFLHDLGPDPDTHVVVVDDNGVILASSDASQMFRALPRADAYRERLRAHRPLVTEDLACEFASGTHAAAPAVAVMVPLRFAPWAVVVQQHKAQAFAGLYRTRRGLVIAGLMLAAMGLLLARALSRSVVAPIQQLSREAEAIRAGDLSRPITVSGDREIEVLARTLDGARERLASALHELRTLNEDLEGQVAARTKVIERKYEDLRLLHAVAELSTREHEPGRIVPEILRLVAGHYGLGAVALVTRPSGSPSTTYVAPAGAAVPWLAAGASPPPEWQRRDIVYQGALAAELFHPRTESLDEQVLGALSHQLAISLHGAYLWQRTVEQDEQRQVLVRRLLSATEEERRRLARELHDEISQLLTVIQLSLDHVRVDTPDMTRAKDLLARTQQEIHRIIYDLRPSLLDDLGLAAAVKSHAHDYLERAGLSVSLEVEEGLPSRPEIEITTFRIYQELVTNILRHARAEHVSVELYERHGRLVLAVEDDGVGFDPNEKSGGVGITGMRERVALVSGTLRIDSEPGSGTHVEVEIPIP